MNFTMEEIRDFIKGMCGSETPEKFMGKDLPSCTKMMDMCCSMGEKSKPAPETEEKNEEKDKG